MWFYINCEIIHSIHPNNAVYFKLNNGLLAVIKCLCLFERLYMCMLLYACAFLPTYLIAGVSYYLYLIPNDALNLMFV